MQYIQVTFWESLSYLETSVFLKTNSEKYFFLKYHVKKINKTKIMIKPATEVDISVGSLKISLQPRGPQDIRVGIQGIDPVAAEAKTMVAAVRHAR